MNTEQMFAEIRDANLNYLMLAQSLIRQDRSEAVFRLGLNEEAADLLVRLSSAQLRKLATGNTLLCRFRIDDDMVWKLLTNQNISSRADNESTNRLHANILMAGRTSEVV